MNQNAEPKMSEHLAAAPPLPKVLIVDDTPSKQMALEAILQDGLQGQAEFLIASSGKEALRMVLDHDFAAILLDVNMPGLSGFEVAEMILSRARSAHIPILFITAEAQINSRAFSGYSLGAVDFINSPFIPEMICAKVQVFLKLYTMRQELEAVNQRLSDELESKEEDARKLRQSNQALVRAQAEQIKTTRELELLTNTAPVAIMHLDTEGRIRALNTLSEMMTGVQFQDVKGEHWYNAIRIPENRAKVEGILQAVADQGGTFSDELTLTFPNGESASILVKLALLRDDQGAINGTVCVAQDITERKRMAQKLAESNLEAALGRAAKEMAEELATMMETASAPIFGIDRDGNITEWNQTMSRITGLPKQTVTHDVNAALGLLTGADASELRHMLRQALSDQATEKFHLRMRSPSGKIGEVLFSCTPRRNIRGEIIGAISIGQDISELREAQAQLIQASKLASLGEMSTSVAHELNQPLNVIRMAAGNCLRKSKNDTLTPEYLGEKLQRIEAQTARAAAIVDHMRMFGRKAAVEPEVLSPSKVAGSALELMKEQLRLDNIEVRTRFSSSSQSARVLGHQIPLEQVILNLLGNARDAIKQHGGERKVLLTTCVQESSVLIGVHDTGGGVPEDVLDRVFEPFFTTKEVGKGTGLGLSVGYGIIHDMGGKLEVINGKRGASFIIRLPQAPVACEQPMSAQA